MPEEHAKRHAKDLRKGRVSLPGQVYHVTAVTRDRAPVFSDLYSARRERRRATRRRRWRTW